MSDPISNIIQKHTNLPLWHLSPLHDGTCGIHKPFDFTCVFFLITPPHRCGRFLLPSLADCLVDGCLEVAGCVGVAGVGRWVEGTSSEDLVGEKAAGLPVLVSQQGVDKRVTRCLAVGQTFGQHAPVGTYGARAEELYHSTSNQGKREESHASHSLQPRVSSVWVERKRSISLL